jgi:DNA-binding response OmpR family regulator
VLLLGSYPPLTRVLRLALEEEGFTVHVACPDRPEGASIREECDVVVLDVKSSGDSALSVVRRWCRGGLRAPVLALVTPHVSTDLTSTVDAWLAKPFDLNDLLATLRALVRSV